MRFTHGEVVVCNGAPWHDHSELCEIDNYGPEKYEPVTIDIFLEDQNGTIYFRLKEYPNDPRNPEKVAAYREDFFDQLETGMSLITLINIPTHDPKTA